MKIVKVGDKGRAACHTCSAFTDTTYQLKDVPLSDGSGIARNVLVGVCDQCGSVTAIPHQSTPMIKQVVEKKRHAIESRVPAHMLDILNLVSIEVSGDTTFVPQIMKYYLHGLSQKSIPTEGIGGYLNDEFAKGKEQKRLSLIGRYVVGDIEELKQLTSIDSTSDLIKSVVLKINDDILVKRKPEPIRQLSDLVAATA